jgi:tetratricopeptide (TPR) repeat protein
VVDECQALVKEDLEHFASAYAYAAIPARYALERRQWSEAAALEPRPSRVKYTEAITYFARALGAARSGDAVGARPNVEKLQELHKALVEAKQDYWAGQVEIQHRAAAAWLARAEGKPEEAVRLMREAAALEDATEKHPVTPGPIFPARELLGDLLLALEQPAPALQEFEASIPKEPNRFNGLYGAARAAELAGEAEKARTYYGQLVALSAGGDTDRPALQQAKAFLAKK